MGGLVEVLRLYPEYQQQFANDIQHDLTFNLREGYESQDSDIGPSFPLPSISEDDENQHDADGGDDEHDNGTATATTASPHHSLSTPSPHHGRSPLLGMGSPRLMKMHKRGRSMITMRERIMERQRTVNASSSIDTTGSYEDDINLIGDQDDINSKKRKPSMERLDSQVSTLHQDVAQLSIEVRTAIQALQEMTFSTINSQVNLKFPPARSIPNISGNTIVNVTATGATYTNINNEDSNLQRCSSHPPEIWGRDMHCLSGGIVQNVSPVDMPSVVKINQGTQTDFHKIDFPTFERFVLANPRLVLGLLGIEPKIKTEIELLQQQKTLQVSPLNTIEEVMSPADPNPDDMLDFNKINSRDKYPWNSSSYTFEEHQAVTKPLVSADEIRCQSVLVPNSPPPPYQQTISSVGRKTSKVFASDDTSLKHTSSEIQPSMRSNRRHSGNLSLCSSSSNSSGSLASNCSSPPPLKQEIDTSKTFSTTDQKKYANTTKSKNQNINIIAERSSLWRGHTSNTDYRRLSDSCAENSSTSPTPQYSLKSGSSHIYGLSDADLEHKELLGSRRSSRANSLKSDIDIDETKNCTSSSCVVVNKRTTPHRSSQGLNRSSNPLNTTNYSPKYHRFSAGDADKLEKGLRSLSSTRSLREENAS